MTISNDHFPKAFFEQHLQSPRTQESHDRDAAAARVRENQNATTNTPDTPSRPPSPLENSIRAASEEDKAPLEAAITETRGLTDDLGAIIARLERKLAPVLGPDLSQPTAHPANEETPAQSPVVEYVEATNRGLNSRLLWLDSIIDRLEC